jgi:hypothetical protein
VREFRNDMAGAPTDQDSNQQSGEDHGYPKPLKVEAPARVFHEPEQNMQVLHSAILRRYDVHCFFLHEGFVLKQK